GRQPPGLARCVRGCRTDRRDVPRRQSVGRANLIRSKAYIARQAQEKNMENYIQGEWRRPSAVDVLPVLNPATGEELGRTPLSPAAEVDLAVEAAARAYPEWRRVPVTDRVQFLFKLKNLLEDNFED